MTTGGERLPADLAKERLNTGINTIKTALHHPILLPVIYNRLSSMFQNIHIVSDREFGLSDEESEINRLKNPFENPSEIFTGHRASFVFSYSSTKEPAIIIRSSYLEDTRETYVRDSLPGLLSEELGHAYSPIKTVPLIQIPEKSYFLSPYSTFQEMLDHINKFKELYHLTSALTPEDIDMRIHGFGANIIIKPSNIRLNPTVDQIIYEETRAAILKTVFESVSMSPHHGKNLDKQFSIGMSNLRSASERRSLQYRNTYLREFTSLEFLDEYLKNFKTMQLGLKTLLNHLYDQSPDFFFNSLPNNTRTSMQNLVDVEESIYSNN